MLKHHKKKILLFIFSMGLILFFAGCVDTNVQPIPSKFDYRSELNIVNLATDALNVSMISLMNNGADINIGLLALAQEWPSAGLSFQNIPSGKKGLITTTITGKDTLKFFADTERRIRIFIVHDSTGYDYIKSVERYTWQTDKSDTNTYLKDFARVAFVNCSPDSTLGKMRVIGTDAVVDTVFADSLFTLDLKFKGGIGYKKFTPGTYSFKIISGTKDTLSTVETKFDAKGRYTVAFYGQNSSLKNKVFLDD